MMKKGSLTVLLVVGIVLFLLGIILAAGGASVALGVVALFVGFVLMIAAAAAHGQRKRKVKAAASGEAMRSQIAENMQRARKEEKRIREEREKE